MTKEVKICGLDNLIIDSLNMVENLLKISLNRSVSFWVLWTSPWPHLVDN